MSATGELVYADDPEVALLINRAARFGKWKLILGVTNLVFAIPVLALAGYIGLTGSGWDILIAIVLGGWSLPVVCSAALVTLSGRMQRRAAAAAPERISRCTAAGIPGALLGFVPVGLQVAMGFENGEWWWPLVMVCVPLPVTLLPAVLVLDVLWLWNYRPRLRKHESRV